MKVKWKQSIARLIPAVTAAAAVAGSRFWAPSQLPVTPVASSGGNSKFELSRVLRARLTTRDWRESVQ